jgi:hypothetical protein
LILGIVLANYRDPTDEKEKEEYGHVSFKLMLSFSMQVSHLFAKFFFCSRWWNPTFFCCSVARSLQAFTATPSKNHGHLGDLSRPPISFITATFSHISGFLSCHFYSFSTQLLLLLASLLLRLCLLMLVSLA